MASPDKFPAMQTPFAVPDICSNLTVITSVTYAYRTYRPPFTIVIPDEGDPRYTSCHPPGWDPARVYQYRFVFKPAVCPRDWTAYNINATDRITGAKCCPSGFTYNQVALTNRLLPGFNTIPGFSGTLCLKTVTSTTSFWVPASTTATPAGTSATSPVPTPTSAVSPSSQLRESTKTIFQVVHPYTIEWAESDRENLSPRPPILGCPGKLGYGRPSFASWNPAQPAPSLDCSVPVVKEPDIPWVFDPKYIPTVIVCSILGLFVVVWVLVCWRRSAKRRRARNEARAAMLNHELGVVGLGKAGASP